MVITELAILFAKVGIQVFVATHDFLLSSQLSLAAEYQTDEALAVKPRFVSLYRKRPAAPVEVEWGDTLADLQNNPILTGFAAHYDREQRMFSGATAEKK